MVWGYFWIGGINGAEVRGTVAKIRGIVFWYIYIILIYLDIEVFVIFLFIYLIIPRGKYINVIYPRNESG